jgi:hypothetical protein
MTLLVQKPSGAKLLMRQSYVGTDDPDAAVYIAAVEAADGQSLESAVQVAIHSFVKGCKADGIWPAIKASCILSGARTLAGALVPLVGTAPTNFNFVSGDYNRKTGLAGNASTKYLGSNRNSDSDPQDNCHLAVYASTGGTAATVYVGGSANFGKRVSADSVRFNSGANSYAISPTAPTLVAASRSTSGSYSVRHNAQNFTATNASVSSGTVAMAVFATNNNGSIQGHTDARLAFYSIGESLDLTLLDARVTQLITTFAAVIP